MLNEIKDALVGDMKSPGLISELHEVKRDLTSIKCRCKDLKDIAHEKGKG